MTNKAAVEKALEVSNSKPVTGAWYWDGNQTLYFRTMNYWPANTTVSFNGHLDGVEASPGVFFTADLTQTFDIGPSLVVVANTRTHFLNVFYKGRPWGDWPISTGRPGLDTVDGSRSRWRGQPGADGRQRVQRAVNDAVGSLGQRPCLHLAPWSVGEQGTTDVSHGPGARTVLVARGDVLQPGHAGRVGDDHPQTARRPVGRSASLYGS